MAKRKSSTSAETAVANAVGDALESAVANNPAGLGKLIFIIIALVVGIVLGVIGDRMLINATSPHVTVQEISEQISEVSELATEKLDYSGMVHYTEGNIRFLTEKAFTMTYNATVKAGVDLSKAEISVDDSAKQINVKLPKAEMQSIEIDPNSLQFQDEERAILNWTTKDDTSQALQIAEENAKEKVDENDLITKAQETSQTLIENLLKPFTIEGLGYKVNVTSESK